MKNKAKMLCVGKENRFSVNSNICKFCEAYTDCQRIIYKKLADKVKPIKVKGKCPEGSRTNVTSYWKTKRMEKRNNA